MWEFLLLQWRVERMWIALLNNKYVSLAQLVQRGELDDIFEGIASPQDDYAVCLEKFRKLIALGHEFLNLVDAEVRRAIEELRDPYPETDEFVPIAGEIPVDEE